MVSVNDSRPESKANSLPSYIPSPVNNSDQHNDSITKVNNDLYALMQTTKVDMDYDLFCVLIDLLRSGVPPDTLFVFLSTIIPYTRVGKKLALKKRRQKSEKIAKENRKENQIQSSRLVQEFI